MHESDPHNDASEALTFQALLYASGELDDAEASAFESRLAADQAAREALAQAVQFSQGALSVPPDSRWRLRVRNRLGPQRSFWRRLLGRRHYPGHPAVWCLLGASIAALIMIVTAPPTPIYTPAPQDKLPAPTAEAARLWAELPLSDHLSKARTEEARRKLRSEDRARLATTDERRLRLSSSPAWKH